MKKIHFNKILLLWVIIMVSACGDPTYTPKPMAYSRIALPKGTYKPFTEACNYTFKAPTYANVVPDSDKNTQACWYNMQYPSLNATLHISYLGVKNKEMFAQMVNDAHDLAFKHTVKAEAIDERRISIPQNNVYGVYYAIDGNAASAVQFFLTDSNNNYLRGSLYFKCLPNADSLAPALNFIKTDIDTLISTLRWK